MGKFGGPELLIILVAVLVLFGAKRLPEIGKGLGQGFRSFKKGLTGEDEDADPEALKENEGS